MDDFESDLGKKFEEDDFYWDERGYRVFTAHYLLKRGYCCKNNCRHCPYNENELKIQEQKYTRDEK